MAFLKNIKLYRILLVLVCLLYKQANAQNIEFGVMLGGSNYMGDVSEQRLQYDQTHFSGSVIGRYNISRKLAVKGLIGYGKISGADSLATKNANKIRNTNFTSNILEFSFHFEYNLVKNNLSARGHRPFVPYIFAGIGVFNFNPTTNYKGQTYELQPLGTEGQGTTNYNSLEKYALTNVCVPIGFGVRKKVAKSWVVGVEVGARFTFTNYLDDVGGKYADALVVGSAYGQVAQDLANRTAEVAYLYPEESIAVEGDPRTTKAPLVKNDMYFMAGISLSYIIRPKGQNCPGL